MTGPRIDAQISAVAYAAKRITAEPVHGDLLDAVETLKKFKSEEARSAAAARDVAALAAQAKGGRK